MKPNNKRKQHNEAYRAVKDVIDQAWLEAGMSREELEQEDRIVRVFCALEAFGRAVDDIEAEWKNLSHKEILSRYGHLLKDENPDVPVGTRVLNGSNASEARNGTVKRASGRKQSAQK